MTSIKDLKAMKKLTPATPARIAWEIDVFHLLEERLDISRSDAQGLVMPRAHVLDEAYERGMSPDDAATLIESLAVRPRD